MAVQKKKMKKKKEKRKMAMMQPKIIISLFLFAQQPSVHLIIQFLCSCTLIFIYAWIHLISIELYRKGLPPAETGILDICLFQPHDQICKTAFSGWFSVREFKVHVCG